MVIITQDMIKQFLNSAETIDEPLKITFENLHQGYPAETAIRFLKARDGNTSKAHKMLVDCLNWRIENEIDKILSKPIIPAEFYRSVRNSQLIGMSGYTKDGRPVIAIGVGLSTYDKASIHYYVQSHIQINEYRDRVILPSATRKFERHISTCVKVLDMTGLKLSHLNQIKLLTVISSIDDLNYPEKTDTYYIVNAPYVFSACWKVCHFSSSLMENAGFLSNYVGTSFLLALLESNLTGFYIFSNMVSEPISTFVPSSPFSTFWDNLCPSSLRGRGLESHFG